MKKKKCGKWAAVVMAAALFAGTLSGCGREETGGGEAGSSFVPIPGMEEGGGPSGQGGGRYVEYEEVLPAEWEDQTIAQMYKADGKLRFLVYGQEGEKTVIREWEKQEGGYADVTAGWLSSLELVCCGGWVELQILQGKDGLQYLYAGYLADGEEGFKGHLWKGRGDTAEEITAEEWTAQFGVGLALLENGSLISISYTSMDTLSGEDGSVVESVEALGRYDGKPVSDGENIYLCSPEGSGGQIEKRKDGKEAGMEILPYPSGGGDGSGVMVFGSAGGLSLDVLEDGTLVAAQEKGIFRLAGGAADGQWELLAAGMETDFAITDYYCTDFTALEDGSIYALFASEGERKLNRYEYDPDAVSTITEVLRLYTVYEDSLLKQAAALYHKAHPGVWIDIQYVYPMYSDDEPDYNGVYQSFNTMLMGDNAPDIVVMDHLNIDSYSSKGLLEDLDDVVRPLEEKGQVLSNITGAYVREDGKRYAVPLQFAFHMGIGREIGAAQMGSMEALAQFLAGTEDNYMGNRTVTELVDEFYPYFCDEIVDGKALDKEALGRYLKYLKAIGDNCGIIASRPRDELALGRWDLAGEAKFAFWQVGGFSSCMFPMTMVDYIKGDFAAFENRFLPSMQMGICTKSRYTDTAKDFLEFSLSKEVQNTESYRAFPVNRDSLEMLAYKDRSNVMASTMIMADDGSYVEFTSKAYPKETAQRLVEMCEGLERPIKEDSMIRQTLTECLGAYLDGTQSLEDTVQKMEDGLKMYLAE